MYKEHLLTELGLELKQIRRSKGFTQQQVSQITNIARNIVSDIERGRFLGSIGTLLKYMRWANLTLTYTSEHDEFPQLDQLAALFGDD